MKDVKLRFILPIFAVLCSTQAYSSNQESALFCSDDEIDSYIENYNEVINNDDFFGEPSYKDWKDARTVAKARTGDSASLCDAAFDVDFDISKLMPDFSAIQDSWRAIQAIMAAESGGLPNLISAATKEGIEKMKEAAYKGVCKVQNKAVDFIDKGSDEYYQKAKDMAKDSVLDSEIVRQSGVNDFTQPIWKQAAGKQLDDLLGEYSEYSKWYEDGYEDRVTGGAAGVVSGSIDDQIDSVVGDL